jgi:hypothetical protein
MLRFAQHDNVGMWMLHCACASFSMTGNVMPSTFVMAGIVSLRAFLLCHSERSEESTVWMLRFAQHDNVGMWMLHCACASFSMTGNVMPSTFVMAGIVSLRAFLLCHSERSEESTVWMLRFAQHDNVGMWMLHCACASFSMTGNVMPSTFVMTGIVSLRAFLLCHSERSEESTVWMLRFAQHDNVGMWMLRLCFVQHDRGEDSQPSPIVPLLAKGEERFRQCRNRVRSCFASLGMVGAFSVRNNRILALFCETYASLESWKTQANLSE